MSLSKARKYTRIDTRAVPSGRDPQNHDSHGKWLGVTRGVLVRLIDPGDPLVDFEGNPEGQPLLAISTVTLQNRDLGREAVLMFEDGDVRRPIIVGLIQTGQQRVPPVSAELDGETLELSAKRQIVLRCGEASLTLTQSGKVLIRGKYVLSRSSGVNMIKGGIVHIN